MEPLPSDLALVLKVRHRCGTVGKAEITTWLSKVTHNKSQAEHDS